jgi:hypothetical protein
VCLVDDEERNSDGVQQREECIVLELLGRRIGDPHGARPDPLASPQLLLFRKGRVQRDNIGDAPLAQHVELVLHQRD